MNLKPIENDLLPSKQQEFLTNLRAAFQDTDVICEAVLVSKKEVAEVMHKESEIDLSGYVQEFRSIVYKHAETLSPDDFSSYRNIALANGASSINLSELVNQAVGEIDSEFYGGLDEKIELEEIAGQPVYFVPGFGIYFWPSPVIPFSLDFWLTHPAYPPGW